MAMRREGGKNARCEVAFFFVARKKQHLHFSVKIVFLSAMDPLTLAGAEVTKGECKPRVTKKRLDPVEYACRTRMPHGFSEDEDLGIPQREGVLGLRTA